MNDAPQELHRLLDTIFAAELSPALRREALHRLSWGLHDLDRHLASEEEEVMPDGTP